MKTVHTLGCSFTSWLYPTWSDYISLHTDLEVINLASSGQGNDAIKYNLYTIDSSDHVFIMFSGYDRFNLGIDPQWIQKNDLDQSCKKKIKEILNYDQYHYFLNRNYLLGFVSGRYLTDYGYSNFHYYTRMLEYIYDCQNYLEAKGIDYTFCMWQGFYNRTEEIKAIDQPKNNIKNFRKNKLYKKLNDSINWDKFVEPVKNGLWEHITSDKTLIEVQSTIDVHPSTLCHLSYFKNYIKPILDKKITCKNNLDELEKKAYFFSKYYNSDFCKKINQEPLFNSKTKKHLMKIYHQGKNE